MTKKFSADDAKAHGAPLLRLDFAPSGRPESATGAVIIRAPIAKLWSIVADVGSYADRVPMLRKVTREGDRVTLHLKFKVSLLSVTFEVATKAREEPPRVLDLRYVSGEPKDLFIRFELDPVDEESTLLHASIGFDVDSLGWLVKYFLKHHPEIELGIFLGCAAVLVDSMRRGVEQLS